MKMFLRVALILLVISLFGVCFVLPAACDNAPIDRVVFNEDFDDGKPACAIHGLDVVAGDSIGHSGSSCLKGYEPKPQTGPHNIQIDMNVNPDSLYMAEFWARSDNKCCVGIGLVSPDSPDSREGLITRFYDIPDTWTRYHVIFRPSSPDLRLLRINGPHTWAGPPGTVWIDDIRVTEIAGCKAEPFTQLSDYVEDCALAKTGDQSAQVLYLGHVAGKERKLTAKELELQEANGQALMGFDHEEGYDRLVTMSYQSGKWGGETELARGMIFHPTIASTKTGDLCAAWTQKGAAGAWTITYRLRTKDGWSKPIAVSSGKSAAWNPSVTVDASGNFWCAWTGYDGPNCRISLCRLTHSGAVDASIISAKDRNAYRPDAAVDADGLLWVAWHEFDGQSYNVAARRMPVSIKSGRPYAVIEGNPITIAGTGEDEAHVTITPSPNKGGGMWFAYDTGVIPMLRTAVLGQRFSMRNELAHWKNGRITALYPDYGDYPLTRDGELGQVAFDGRGNLWLLERTCREEDAHWDVVMRRYDGTGWTNPVIISGGKQGYEHQPQVANLQSGMLLVWQADNRDRENDFCMAYGRQSYLIAQTVPSYSDEGREPDGITQKSHPSEQATVDKPSERFSINYNGKKLYVFWGDLHVHSRISVCTGNRDLDPFDAYFYPRDYEGIDFMALTDHSSGMTYVDRYNIRKLAKLQNNPPHFVSIFAQESGSNAQGNGIGYGHRNVFFLDDDYKPWWEFYDTKKNTPASEWEMLRETGGDAFTIPHQIADHMNFTETDWSFHDDEMQPVAEIYQIRGSYEYLGCPWQAGQGSKVQGAYYQDALDLGHHLGVIASSDHGGGQGFAAVFAEKLDREPVLRAIQTRRCYGTTEAYMLLDFRVNGHLMGEMIKDNGAPRNMSIRVEALQPFKEIVVFKNDKMIFQKSDGLGSSFTTEFKDTGKENGEDWYYLRAIQRDGKIAWSSPVWVKS